MMKNYIGTKTLSAMPMNLGEYNVHRGWDIPLDEDPSAPGYLVEYPDGYRSWSPQAQFEEAYQTNGAYDFGHALYFLHRNKRLSREGWNGKNMFVYLVQGSEFTISREPLISHFPQGQWIKYLPHIDMITAQGDAVPWLASQTDVLATDWGVVD